MKIKKNSLLAISFIGSILLVVIKYTESADLFRNLLGRQYLEIFFNTIIFFPVLLLFSLLIYFLPQAIFAAWWKFSRLGIPLVFGLVILINLRLHHTPGGFLNLDSAVDTLLVGIIFGIFIFGSLVQIARGWLARNK